MSLIPKRVVDETRETIENAKNKVENLNKSIKQYSETIRNKQARKEELIQEITELENWLSMNDTSLADE